MKGWNKINEYLTKMFGVIIKYIPQDKVVRLIVMAIKPLTKEQTKKLIEKLAKSKGFGVAIIADGKRMVLRFRNKQQNKDNSN